MTTTLQLDIPEREWDQVATLTAALCPAEGDGDHVWLEVDRGRRRWFAAADEAEWSLDGGSDGTEVTCLVPLPPRAVWFAGELAQLDGSTRLTVDGETLLLEAPTSGSAAFDLPVRATEPPIGGHGPIAATAEIGSDRLAHLLRAVTLLPPGAELEESPELWIAIEDGHVAAAVDWRPAAGRSTFRVDARSTEGHAAAALRSLALLSLVRRVNPADSGSVLLGIPEESGHPVVLTGEGWIVRFGTERHCLTDRLDDVALDLRRAGWSTARDEDDALLVGGNGHRIRIAVFDEPVPIARVTTIVASSIEPTGELLAHVNATNSGLANVRVWIEDERVVAGTDVPVAHLDGVAAAVAHLVASVEGFDVFFGGLSAAS